MEISIYPIVTIPTDTISKKYSAVERVDFKKDPEDGGYDFFLQIHFKEGTHFMDVVMSAEQVEFLAKSMLLHLEIFNRSQPS